MEIQNQDQGNKAPITVEMGVLKSSLMDLNPALVNMLPEERRIINLKYKGKRIKDMTPDELVLHCKGLAYKTFVITGWQLPDSVEHINVFEDQLRKFLVDEYMNINVDEYEYAMRVFGTTICDWGKSMNLSLIRGALDAYLEQRAELSILEEQAFKSPETPKQIDPVETDWSDTLEKLISDEITGVFEKLTPYSAIYDWAFKTGLISPTNAEKWEFMNQAREIERIRLENKRVSLQSTPDDREMNERLKSPSWHKDYKATSALISLSKELAIKQLVIKLQKEKNEKNHN